MAAYPIDLAPIYSGSAQPWLRSITEYQLSKKAILASQLGKDEPWEAAFAKISDAPGFLTAPHKSLFVHWQARKTEHRGLDSGRQSTSRSPAASRAIRSGN